MQKFYPLIENYGYVIVLFGVMLGTAGIPFPSAAVLLAAGVLVQQGHLDIWYAIVVGIVGAVIGNQIGYLVGHRAGRSFVLKWGRYMKLTPERLDHLEGLFALHGGRAVFVARFFSVFRVLEALVAGISRMHWGTFLFYSVLSGAVWAPAVVLVGYSERAGARRSIGQAAPPSCLFFYSGLRWASTSSIGWRLPAVVDKLYTRVPGRPLP